MKKVLVRLPQWLGDAVVSTVFLNQLKEKTPECEIHVSVVPSLAPVFESHPAVKSVIPLPYPKGHVFQAANEIKKKNFDAVYILPRSFRSAMESCLARIPVRIGYGGDLRSLLLTEVHPYEENRLYAQRYLALIGQASVPVNQYKPFFPVATPVSPPILKKPLLGMAPCSVARSRTWFPDRFVEVANQFQAETGGTVLLFGSAKEHAAIERIASQIKGSCVNTAGGLSLGELGWFMNQCNSFVGNDSGLMHVAAVFNIPSVVLFGPSNPVNAVPPWGQTTALQHNEVPCVPCLRNDCVRFGDDNLACLKLISVDEIMEILRKKTKFKPQERLA